jgi:hypothetical protein
VSKLTAKQEGYAKSVVSNGGKKAQAYKDNYSTSGMSSAAVSIEADKLYKHPKVSLRIEGLQVLADKVANKKFEVTVEQRLKMLYDVAVTCSQTGDAEEGATPKMVNPTAVIAAIDQLNKMTGDHAAIKQKLEHEGELRIPNFNINGVLMIPEVDVKIPKNLLKFLTVDARIKVAFGGRGGGKTESIARMLPMRGVKQKQRAFCLRQHMNSIEDSVHSVLAKSIEALELDGFYNVLKNRIDGVNDSTFIYGQLASNLTSIKSKDDVDIAWVEEAEDVSADALEVLIPSVRADDDSELWFSFNPKDPAGAVYSRFVEPYIEQLEKDRYYYEPKTYHENGELDNPGLLVVWVNLEDNPLAPSVLRAESNAMKKADLQKWLNIWGGFARIDSDDDNLIKAEHAIYASKVDNMNPEGPLVIGVDPARFGKDKTAIIRRRGRVAFSLAKLSNQSTMEVAGRVALICKLENPDMVFIDVGGLGAGVYDRLVELGYGDVVKAVNFGGKAMQPERFLNKRAEMWATMGGWLEEVPVSIPDDAGLVRDLVTPKYKIRSNGQIQLESKDEMKKRLSRSTDSGDALALTFAYPVAQRDVKKEQFYSQPSFTVGDTVAGY